MSRLPLISPTRRAFFREAFGGFGTLALAALARDEQLRAAPPNPLAPKPPRRAARPRAVLLLYMPGGPSHLETFDPKPLLNRLDGQPRPAEFGDAKYQFVKKDARLLGCRRKFARSGQSGVEVSNLFPHTARCI